MADQVTFDEAQQTLVNKLVGEARVKARETAKTEFEVASTKAKEDAEKVALAANQKWQELAAKHEARVKELEPFEGQAAEYVALMDGMLKDKIKELGDAAKTAVKDMKASAMEKLAWLNANVALFQASGGVGTPASRKLTHKKKSAGDVGHTRLKM